MVGTLTVESELVTDDVAKVAVEGTCEVANADQGVPELNVEHFVLWELVILEVFAVAFHGFGDFAMDEAEEFTDVALQGVKVWVFFFRAVPPTCVDLFLVTNLYQIVEVMGDKVIVTGFPARHWYMVSGNQGHSFLSSKKPPDCGAPGASSLVGEANTLLR